MEHILVKVLALLREHKKIMDMILKKLNGPEKSHTCTVHG